MRKFENFVQLTAEQLGNILQSDREVLNIDSERDAFDVSLPLPSLKCIFPELTTFVLFQALMDWYNYEKEKREADLSPLLALIRLPTLPSSVSFLDNCRSFFLRHTANGRKLHT